MRPFQSTIALGEAKDIIAAATTPLDRTEQVALADARGRVLARDVTAPADVPPFARAAMDGYAVRAADVSGASRDTPVRLRRIETIYTGQMPVEVVAAGLCSEVATGAPMPEGADAVVMVEETSADADAVQFFAAATAGQNIGRQGQDIRSREDQHQRAERTVAHYLEKIGDGNALARLIGGKGAQDVRKPAATRPRFRPERSISMGKFVCRHRGQGRQAAKGKYRCDESAGVAALESTM